MNTTNNLRRATARLCAPLSTICSLLLALVCCLSIGAVTSTYSMPTTNTPTTPARVAYSSYESATGRSIPALSATLSGGSTTSMLLYSALVLMVWAFIQAWLWRPVRREGCIHRIPYPVRDIYATVYKIKPGDTVQILADDYVNLIDFNGSEKQPILFRTLSGKKNTNTIACEMSANGYSWDWADSEQVKALNELDAIHGAMKKTMAKAKEQLAQQLRDLEAGGPVPGQELPKLGWGKYVGDDGKVYTEEVHPDCERTKVCQETEGFRGTEREGLDMCEDGCVWAGSRFTKPFVQSTVQEANTGPTASPGPLPCNTPPNPQNPGCGWTVREIGGVQVEPSQVGTTVTCSSSALAAYYQDEPMQEAIKAADRVVVKYNGSCEADKWLYRQQMRGLRQLGKEALYADINSARADDNYQAWEDQKQKYGKYPFTMPARGRYGVTEGHNVPIQAQKAEAIGLRVHQLVLEEGMDLATAMQVAVEESQVKAMRSTKASPWYMDSLTVSACRYHEDGTEQIFIDNKILTKTPPQEGGLPMEKTITVTLTEKEYSYLDRALFAFVQADREMIEDMEKKRDFATHMSGLLKAAGGRESDKTKKHREEMERSFTEAETEIKQEMAELEALRGKLDLGPTPTMEEMEQRYKSKK